MRHLNDSIWTFELEHSFEVFSLSTYLNWINFTLKANDKYRFWYTNFPEKILHYLERKVSNPFSQTKFEIQLLILIRENMTFIATIACVTWSILTLPSITPKLE
jgi:hypothetical protein